MLRPGERISFRNWEEGGGLTNAKVSRDRGAVVEVITPLKTLVELRRDNLYKPMEEGLTHVLVGDKVSFRRFLWWHSTGTVTSIKDNKVRISTTDSSGNIKHTWISTNHIKKSR